MHILGWPVLLRVPRVIKCIITVPGQTKRKMSLTKYGKFQGAVIHNSRNNHKVLALSSPFHSTAPVPPHLELRDVCWKSYQSKHLELPSTPSLLYFGRLFSYLFSDDSSLFLTVAMLRWTVQKKKTQQFLCPPGSKSIKYCAP